MPELSHVDKAPKPDATPSVGERTPRDDVMEEEEKILAGRPDVNMPSLLTKDVQGG